MKRLGLLLAFFALLSLAGAQAQGITLPGPGLPVTSGGGPVVPARTQPGVVHSNGGTASTTVSVSLANPVSANGTVILTLGDTDDPTTSVVTVLDDKGNSYTNANILWDAGNGFGTATYYLNGITNGPKTFTVTLTQSRSFLTLIAGEFSGVAASSAIDGHTIIGQTNPAAGANAISSGAITPTANGDLIYGVTVSLAGASSTLVPGTGFTQDAASGVDFLTEYLVQSTAASVPATFGFTGSTGPFQTAILAFKHS